MKIIKWVIDNILFIFTLFLLAFIPLYPKLPLFDVQHTWVYVRVEDFVVALVLMVWAFLLIRKKITLKTPLTFPIFLFWLTGGIATMHGVLFVFPSLAEVYSNVAFFSFLRRIEYISLFFIAFAGTRDKKYLSIVVGILAVVLLCIVGYGFGQKYYEFPAFLTMNEEFAKGDPIQLSQLSRIPSTFAGHYDLAAYLVLIIPLLTSMVFGFRSWIIKLVFLMIIGLGFLLLFATVSRVSVFVLFLSLVLLIILHKKKWLLISLFLVTLIAIPFSSTLLARFGNTVSEVDVLVNAKTGEAMGHVKDVPAEYFKDKVILRYAGAGNDAPLATTSAILPFILLPPQSVLLTEANTPTGENLPQGTGYINLPLSPVVKNVRQFIFEKTDERFGASPSVRLYYGDFIVKRALAYDLSFTTRFQGEWPRTIEAFKNNIFLGSGYASVSLAVDNNYLRILGESGFLGFASFLSIFLIAGIYIKKILPDVNSPIVRSFVLGFVAGTFGLALNAVLIDVFEASKVAFSYWLLMGVTIGTLHHYKRKEINLYKDFKEVISSSYAIILYLLIITVSLYSSSYAYFFVGDDFTLLRQVVNCSASDVSGGLQQCNTDHKTILSYFTKPNGMSYQPGLYTYLFFMHKLFWLNQTMYHLVSISLHFIVAVLLFLITKKIFKDFSLAAMSALLFLVLSGNSAAVFWISSTGILFHALFALLSLLFFLFWTEKKKILYFIISLIFIILSLLFHEFGIIVPFVIILYDIIFVEKPTMKKLSKKFYYLILLLPVISYLLLRFTILGNSFDSNSYRLFYQPLTIFSDFIGYILYSFIGPAALPLNQKLESFMQKNVMFTSLFLITSLFVIGTVYRILMKNMIKEELKIVIFAFLFFVISLLPFLGTGEISPANSYVASIGFAIVLVFILKKIYSYLIRANDQYTTFACIGIMAIIFMMWHLFQLQKSDSEWKSAGEKTQRFFITLSGAYTEEWKKGHMQFYFVNIPSRSGEVWIFRNGLKDPVWFVTRNDNIQIFESPSLEHALKNIERHFDRKAFEFDNNGNITERIPLPLPTK